MDEPVPVAVVEDRWATRIGFVAALKPAHRFTVVAQVGRIVELGVAADSYDICVLDLVGAGTRAEVQRILAEQRSVVVTMRTDWKVLAGAWALGALNVLARSVTGPVLAEAVWAAAQGGGLPSRLLAGALLDAAEDARLPMSDLQLSLLSGARDGYRLPELQRILAVPAARVSGELAGLRAGLRDAGLATLDLAPALPGVSDLTRQERWVLALLADGGSTAQIAGQLGIRPRAVENHLNNAMKALGVQASAAERLLIAKYVSGRHADPEQLWKRIAYLFPSGPP
jgi:DNA-binding NarL/FixJ family response regulator